MKSTNGTLNRSILASDSGRAKIVVLLLLAAVASWYWNHRTPATNTVATTKPTATPAPAQPAPGGPAYDSAQDYARKFVSFAGVTEGQLEKPRLILRFDNRGERDLSNITVQITGYKEFYVQDPSKATGSEYSVDLEVKNFPAKKVTETVLYFPPGILSISRDIKVSDARF